MNIEIELPDRLNSVCVHTGHLKIHFVTDQLDEIERLINFFFVNEDNVSSVTNYTVYSIVSEKTFRHLFKILSEMAVDDKIEAFKEESFYKRFFLDDKVILLDSEKEDHIILKISGIIYLLKRDSTSAVGVSTRLVRELHMRDGELNSGVVLHAAAVERKGKVYILIGSKFSGKTSLSQTLIADRYCNFVSNDRVIVFPDTNQVLSISIPIRLGRGTCSVFPKLRELWNNPKRLSRKQSRAVLNNPIIESKDHFVKSDDKLEVTPKELIDNQIADVSLGGEIATYIIPMIDPEVKGCEVVKVSYRDYWEMLAKQILTPYEEKWIDPWFFKRVEEADVMKSKIEEKMIRSFSKNGVVLLKYGLDYYDQGMCNAILLKELEKLWAEIL